MKFDIVYYLALISVGLVVAGGQTGNAVLEIVGVLVLIFSWVGVEVERLERMKEDD